MGTRFLLNKDSVPCFLHTSMPLNVIKWCRSLVQTVGEVVFIDSALYRPTPAQNAAFTLPIQLPYPGTISPRGGAFRPIQGIYVSI